MIDKRTDFISWVRRALITVPHQDASPGRCTRLEIKHLSAGNRMGNLVANVECPATSDLDDVAIDAIVNDVENLVHVDAGTLGGMQKYVVVPRYKDGTSVGRFAIRVQMDDPDADEEGLDSEPPTKTGIVTQFMRHNEAMMRTTIMGVNQIIAMQQRTIARQAEQLEKHQDSQFQLVELIETLHSQKHERELATKQAEFKHDTIRDISEKVNILLPVVVNKMAGRKVLPEKVTPSEALLNSVLESLTPAQFAELQGILKPEQLIALADMFDVYNRRKEASGNGNAVKQQTD